MEDEADCTCTSLHPTLLIIPSELEYRKFFLETRRWSTLEFRSLDVDLLNREGVDNPYS